MPLYRATRPFYSTDGYETIREGDCVELLQEDLSSDPVRRVLQEGGLVLEPSRPLATLTPEEIQAITEGAMIGPIPDWAAVRVTQAMLEDGLPERRIGRYDLISLDEDWL